MLIKCILSGMRTRYLVLVMVSVLALPRLEPRADVVAATGARETLARHRLFGPVRAVTTDHALFVRGNDPSQGWREAERLRIETAQYNGNRFLTEKTDYAPDGAVTVRVRRLYGKAGRLLKVRLYNTQDELWRETTRFHDATGNLVRAVSTDADGELWFRDEYRHDEDGQPIEVEHYDPDGTFLHRALFQYDENKLISERLLLDADGSPISKNTYRYDVDGRLSELVTYGRGGTIVARWEYQYDERGNEREWVAYRADGTVRRREVFTFEYDDLGNWVKMVTSEWVPHETGGEIEPAEVLYRDIAYYTQNDVH